MNVDSGTYNKAGVDSVANALEAHLRAAGVEVERRRQDAVGDHLRARVRCGQPDEAAPRVLLMVRAPRRPARYAAADALHAGPHGHCIRGRHRGAAALLALS